MKIEEQAPESEKGSVSGGTGIEEKTPISEAGSSWWIWIIVIVVIIAIVAIVLSRKKA